MKKNNLFSNIAKGTGLVVGAIGLTYGGYLLNKSLTKSNIILKIKAIAKELETSNTAIIDFNEIVKESWDTMFIFPTYTSYETIYDALGFNWDEVYKTGISYRDDITLLVFVENDKVVRYIEYPKAYGDFSTLEKDIYNDGIFELSTRNNKIVVKESYE